MAAADVSIANKDNSRREKTHIPYSANMLRVETRENIYAIWAVATGSIREIKGRVKEEIANAQDMWPLRCICRMISGRGGGKRHKPRPP